MNNDLISRSVLLEEINGDENKKADALMREWYADMVKRQPTAYDVDKVVEQIVFQQSGLTTWAEDEAYKLGLEKAIEIVKSGGID